jgi:hypothetical protein
MLAYSCITMFIDCIPLEPVVLFKFWFKVDFIKIDVVQVLDLHSKMIRCNLHVFEVLLVVALWPFWQLYLSCVLFHCII